MSIQKLAAEALGTAFLLIAVVGSGIMAETLSGDLIGLALLANAIATGCMLYAIITVLGPVSGAHFNPAVTLAFLLRGEIAAGLAAAYVAVQVTGGILGVWLSHVMFDLEILQSSTTMHRTGPAQWVAEVVATFGLLFVIFGGLRSRPDAVPTLVALYITDTFAGIFPGHVPGFILAQLAGVGVAHLVLRPLLSDNRA